MSRFEKLETQTAPPGDAPAAASALRTPQGRGVLTYDDIIREADAAFYMGDFRAALRHFSHALQEDNTRHEPWIGQTLAMILLGEMRDADVWSSRGTERFPASPSVLSMRGLVLGMQGMTSRGMGTLDFAMSQGSPDKTCWLARGWLLLEADNANWRSCFDKAVELAGPGDWRLRFLMGLVLENHRKWALAIEQFEACATLNARNFFLWHHLGLCLARMGFTARAIESQRHALDIKPGWMPAERELLRLTSRPISGLLTRAARWAAGMLKKN